MDYVVGALSAIITGTNVTPNRPKVVRRALTPIKHQQSPNVTPKSQVLDDRSLLLSPSVQKKKAIVKKSPKRIFENPDLDMTQEEGKSSPKADKVKKLLKDDFETSTNDAFGKSPKKKRNKSVDNQSVIPKVNDEVNSQVVSVNSPKKKKRKSAADLESVEPSNVEAANKHEDESAEIVTMSPKKNKNKKQKNIEPIEVSKQDLEKNNVNEKENKIDNEDKDTVTTGKIKKKKNKKKKSKSQNAAVEMAVDETSEGNENEMQVQENSESPKKKKNKALVNPNAVTNKDTDSEHESDDEIESENEMANKEILDTGPAENSSDEEEKDQPKKEAKQKKEKIIKEKKDKVVEISPEEEAKRTLFVGNVPFSPKLKKEMKKLFNKYGNIDTVRVRTIPVKDGTVTPKLAVIKNELHKDRTTVNCYIKFSDPSSVEKALVENNTVFNEHHLRVTRSDSTGAEHDPRCAVFVGNLPFAIEDEVLRDKFAKCGDIESVRIIRDKKTNAGKGFGYVNFTSKDGVELALSLTEEDLTIKNRILRVKRCTLMTHKQANKQQNRQGNQANRQGYQGNRQGYQGNRQGNNQGIRQRNNQGSYQGNNQANRQNKGNWQPRNDNPGTQEVQGAHRRLLNKRKNQESGEGPPNKRQNLQQPAREKKQKKEFVGMTAEKKKKHKPDKMHKKKKALSEILSKK